MELRICQSLFDRQAEITRRLLEGLGSTHISHMRSLTDFVDAQASYYAECHQHAQELQKHLTSIPAVFCSNNWQSARSSCVNAKTVDLDDITSMPAVVHRLPDFDQDSWSLNSPTKTERDSSSPALDPTNNNVSTHSRDFSASRLPAAAAASVETVGAAAPANTRPVRETTAAGDALLGSRRQDAASTPVTPQPMSDDRTTLGGPTCIMPNKSHREENPQQL